jgi:hypothetical protein
LSISKDKNKNEEKGDNSAHNDGFKRW